MRPKKKQSRKVPQVRDELATAAKLEMLKAVDDRRYQVVKLFISGRKHVEISRLLGIEKDVVHKDLEVVRKEWIGLATQEVLQLRADEYARLLSEQADAEECFQRSLEPRTVTSATKVGPGGQPITKAVTYKRDGDPRWKAQVLKCIEARCKLLNLNVFDASQHQVLVHTKILYDLPPAVKQIQHEVSGG